MSRGDAMRAAVRMFTCGAAAGGLLLGLAALPAAAAPPENRGSFGVEIIDEDDVSVEEGFCDLDGLTVEVHFVERGRGHFTYRGRDRIPYFTGTFHGSVTFTELSGDRAGTVSSIVWNTTNKDQRIVDNGDGTITVTARGAGGWKFIGPAATLRNPGMLLYQVLIDTNGTLQDPSDDEFLEDLGPLRDSTGLNEQGEDFCEDYFIVTGRTG
jgi:hypothetical protein